MSLPSLEQPFVTGSVPTPVGAVPQVSASLLRADRLGTYKVRWGIGRMKYTINPGLYVLGRPDEKSPVLVTANYKMSFDQLRGALPGRNVWILVLDTKGINVWCSAGKGTFGTTEILSRIESSGLTRVVAHRELILPQLAGPGVAAHLVKKSSGFKVIYGPIRATDLPAFLDAGLKATPQMRLKTFTIRERIALIPVELVGAMKPGAITILASFLLAFVAWAGEGRLSGLNHGLFSVLALLIAILSGAVLTPSLLPWLPGRAFSLKGFSIGVCAAAIFAAFSTGGGMTLTGRLEILAWFFIIPAVSAFLAMNFTGASTFTSLSGVRKEMRWAVPLEIAGGIVGLVFWFGSHFIV